MPKDLRNMVQSKYHLWVSWKDVQVEPDGTIKLIKPCFYGPVMDDCEPLEASQELVLDLTEQYLVVLPRPYEVSFSWSKPANQEQGRAFFDEILIKDNDLGNLAKVITKRDTLLLDCKGHHSDDWNKQSYRLNFRAMIYKEGKEPYNF